MFPGGSTSGLAARGVRLSGGLSPFTMRRTAACIRSLSGFAAGASKNSSAFRPRLRLKPPLSPCWLPVSPQRIGPSATCLSSGAGGRGLRPLLARLIACQCFSLAFRFDGQSQQLGEFLTTSGKMSVAAVTAGSDQDQASPPDVFVLRLTWLLLWKRLRYYFSLATTNSGAQSRARLISESGKMQIDFRADSAYCTARFVAARSDP